MGMTEVRMQDIKFTRFWDEMKRVGEREESRMTPGFLLFSTTAFAFGLRDREYWHGTRVFLEGS